MGAACGGPTLRIARGRWVRSGPGIDERHATVLKVADVPGRNSAALVGGDGGDLSIHDADGPSKLSTTRRYFGKDRCGVPIEAQNSIDKFVKLVLNRVLKFCSALSRRKEVQTVKQFGHRNRCYK